MHATIYGRGQMVIPAQARREARLAKGDVVSVQPDGDGRLLLVRLEKPQPIAGKVSVVRRGKLPAVGVSDRMVSTEEVQKFVDEFPWRICYLANLASLHGMTLATLDTRIQHKAAVLIG
jgi:AbrB family looped-hinge helix DNA binding protein